MMGAAACSNTTTAIAQSMNLVLESDLILRCLMDYFVQNKVLLSQVSH